MTARSHGLIMGMRHRTLPLEGVQFHPESVLTQDGYRMLANWLHECGSSDAIEKAERAFASHGRGARRVAAADAADRYSTIGACSPVRGLFWMRCREACTKMMKAEGTSRSSGIASAGWWIKKP